MKDLFGVKKGLRIFGEEATVEVLNGTSDPSTASGVSAELGSIYLKSDGVSFKKVGAADTDWQPESGGSSASIFIGNDDNADPTVTEYTEENYITSGVSLEDSIDTLDMALVSTLSGTTANFSALDTAHDNLAASVLHETSGVVADAATDEVLDTILQTGNLGAKWFVVAYTASKRYACEIYALHDGSTTSDITEYAILTIGSSDLNVDFTTVADGTNMSLLVANTSGESVTIKTQRIAIQTVAVDTSAVLS